MRQARRALCSEDFTACSNPGPGMGRARKKPCRRHSRGPPRPFGQLETLLDLAPARSLTATVCAPRHTVRSRSGHRPLFAQPELFHQFMTKTVLAQTVTV